MTTIKLCLVGSVVLWSVSSVVAQFRNQRIFENDSGQVLINRLFNTYKPQQVLNYTNARIKMYKEIYNENDTVRCVYTKHALYLDPKSSDPIGYLIKNNNPNGINCEHTYPQSKGSETGNARSDMHHLFPTRASANEARSNYPFKEINDDQTEKWLYKSFTLSTKPLQLIDEYSESINGAFEPREDHKGNAARAIFYFFTMYDAQADRAFFESMRQTLCQWHIMDPVDSVEWTRSQMIAAYQDGKANPFILDCSLARRCYCPTLPNCELISSITENLNEVALFKIHPIPADQHITIESDQEGFIVDRVRILDITGRTRSAMQSIYLPHTVDISDLPAGLYNLCAQANGESWHCLKFEVYRQ